MKDKDGRTYLAHTADVVVFNLQATEFRDTGVIPNVVLVKRGQDPFKGCWSLPGGHIEEGETIEACAKRELEEETGIPARTSGFLAPIGTFSDPKRDPRGHVISTAFISVIPTAKEGLTLKAGDDAAECNRFALNGRAYSKGDIDADGHVIDQDCVFVSLRNPDTKDKIVYAATFERDKNGHSICDVEYDEKNTTSHLAFDHAEILARAIGQCPAIVNPIRNPVEHAPELNAAEANNIIASTADIAPCGK